MKAKEDKFSVPLDSVCELAGKKLAESEYLVERHDIKKGDAYTDLSITAKWLPRHRVISIEVVFLVSSGQDSIKNYLTDDDIKDDIDSGAGESFEDALRSIYPKFDWSYSVGEVKMKCKKAV